MQSGECGHLRKLTGSTPPPTPPSASPSASQDSLPQHPPGKLQRTLSLTRGDSAPAKLIRRLSLSQRASSYSDQPGSPQSALTPRSPFRLSRNNPVAQSAPTTPLSAPIPIRPAFHRRPTNLSEKAAAKGGATGGHVDLEFGLDIKLNCEIKQGDPSGSTETYRLLVPALQYEGMPVTGLQRKPTLLEKLGGSRRASKAAAKQGSGEWGQSNSGTESDSEEEHGGRSGAAYRRQPVVHQQGAKKSLEPFQSRPEPDQARKVSPAMYQTRIPPEPKQPPIAKLVTHNATAALDEDDVSSDGYHEMQVPRRRSKFDSNGMSKFFGAQGGPKDQPGNRDSGASAADAGYRSSGEGYSGIEAYNKPKKGWKRFF